MDKEELSTLREELKRCGEALIAIADRLLPSSEEAVTPTANQPSLEDVRAVLARKAREGLTSQVRELLKRYGAEKLSDIRAEDYLSLLSEAEGITNAR